jgi:sulfoxide reductase catalytic subunit YedY
MLIKIRRSWELPEHLATPESAWLGRRQLLRMAAAGPILAAGASALLAGCDDAGSGAAVADEPGVPPEALNLDDPSADLYPVAANPAFELDRPVTAERLAVTYNNFYEFGSSKNIWQKAQALPLRPWTVRIGGMVERPFDIGIDDLLRKMPASIGTAAWRLGRWRSPGPGLRCAPWSISPRPSRRPNISRW